ncbi:restriction endonuclease subunit S [Methanoregula sp.]|uniref:restriction endonuclease subunit S n=1 Tax=Methanoregula sp. TaxID=2052170 RepID=UPI002D0FA89B|nr:restriction endonuclease subunit S [Methanoregula sp.]HVP95653.1 restriction endonuclease subunit S [Methanoregula sp.]
MANLDHTRKESLIQLNKLGSLASFKTGKLDSNAAKPDGKYPFFTCAKTPALTNTYSFDTECVLLGGNNANGIYPLFYFTGKFEAYQRTYVIQSLDETKLLNRYLFYSLQLQLEILRSISTGAATKFLTLTILNEIEILLPSILTQQKIASILSTYDDLIEKNTWRIKILEEMAQALYREWFVDFRFPGHEGVGMVESELGLVPEGWEIRKISEVCEKIYSGGTPNTKISNYWNGSIPWLSSGETRNHYIISTDKTITIDGISNSSTRLVKAGTTIIASAGQGQTRGQTSFLMLESYINQSIIALIADARKISDLYLYFNLSRRYPELRQISDSNSSRGSLTTKSFTELKIIVPPKELVEKFNAQISIAVNLITTIISQNANLRRTRDLLLPKLISGEIDVSDLDIKIPEAEA